MKFATFEVTDTQGKHERIGIVYENDLLDINKVYRAYLRDVENIYSWQEIADVIIPTDMLRYIENGSFAKSATDVAVDWYKTAGSPIEDVDGSRFIYKHDEVRLKAPIPRPRSLRDCSTFLGHLTHMGAKKLPDIYYKIPCSYFSGTGNVCGPDDPILWPSRGSDLIDYECEFAIVIGKQGKDIPVEAAEDYIFGVTIFNDISARDVQARDMVLRMGPRKGKNFTNSNILGPYIVTLDELDLNNIDIQAWLNGQLMGEDNTSNMYFSFQQLVEQASESEDVFPGEVIGSGTIGPGTSHQFLQKGLDPGDVVEFKSNALGTLRNTVEEKPEFLASKYVYDMDI